MCTQAVVNAFNSTQEHQTFGRFGDSLLTKSAKLEDLIASIEQEMGEKDLPDETVKRAKKSLSYYVQPSTCP